MAVLTLKFRTGCGKKPAMVGLIEDEEYRLTVLVCPKIVARSWELDFSRTAKKQINVVQAAHGLDIHTRRAVAENQIKKAKCEGIPCVLILNYECAWREPMQAFLQGLAAKGEISCLILDHADMRMKKPTGKAGQFFIGIKDQVPENLLLASM